MSTTYVFSVPDIECAGCLSTVEGCLSLSLGQRLKTAFSFEENEKQEFKTITDGTTTITILFAQAQFPSRQLIVMLEEDHLASADVMRLLNLELDTVGFSCQLKASEPKKNATNHWFFGSVGVITGIVLLILSLVLGPLPFVAMVSIGLVSVVLTVILGKDSYKEAIKLGRGGGVNMHTLFAVSTATVMIVSVASFFFPILPMMFEVGLLIFGFNHIGEGIRNTLNKQMGLRTSFQDDAPKRVKKIQDGKVLEVSTDDLIAGDLLLIDTQSVIPVDGVCEEGTGFISTEIQTGDTDLQYVRVNDKMVAGMRLESGQIFLRVSQPAKSSLLARNDANILAANEKKVEESSWEHNARKMIKVFVPMVLVLAITSGIVIGFFFTPALAIQCAAAVLVSACPCTLGLIIPMAAKVGMDKTAESGMRFKNTKKLEDAYLVQHVIFDLNGTLTTTEAFVTDFKITDPESCSSEMFFNYVLTLEDGLRKTISLALCKTAKDKGAVLLPKERLDSMGYASAMIDGHRYCLGNRQMMRTLNIPFVDQPVEGDESTVFLTRDNQVLGSIVLKRPLREKAVEVVHTLKAMGKQVHLCTGADEETALGYARVLGIPEKNVLANCQTSSNHKLRYMRSLSGKKAMVGDGLNDVLVINESDFGIAMPVDGLEDKDNKSVQVAAAVFKLKSLEPIVAAFEISRQTANNIHQNLLFSLLFNITVVLLAGGLLLTIGVALNPGIGAAFMILQTGLIMLNTYRFKQQKLVELKETSSVVVSADQSSYANVTHKLFSSSSKRPSTAPESNQTLSDHQSVELFPPKEILGKIKALVPLFCI